MLLMSGACPFPSPGSGRGSVRRAGLVEGLAGYGDDRTAPQLGPTKLPRSLDPLEARR
jgi:hypothetical protein